MAKKLNTSMVLLLGTQIPQGILGKRLLTKQMKHLEDAQTWAWLPLDCRFLSQVLQVNQGTSMFLLTSRGRALDPVQETLDACDGI